MTLTPTEGAALGAPGLARATARGLSALDHPVMLYLAELSPGSRRAQAGALRACARVLGSDPLALDWARLAPAEVAALRSALAARHAPATVNRFLAAVRGVLRACVALRLVSRDHAADLGASGKSVRGARLPKGRGLAAGELSRLFGALDEHSAMGRRDAAIVALLYGCGLRRAELCALDVEHVTQDGLRVIGKGNVERIVPLPPDVRARLGRWLWSRGVLSGSRENRALFTRARGDGRLGSMGVYSRVRSLAEAAGLPPLSPHDLRRSYAGDLLDRGVDLATVQTLMGHADPAVTASYDRRPARARAAAVEVLSLPELRRDAADAATDRAADPPAE